MLFIIVCIFIFFILYITYLIFTINHIKNKQMQISTKNSYSPFKTKIYRLFNSLHNSNKNNLVIIKSNKDDHKIFKNDIIKNYINHVMINGNIFKINFSNENSYYVFFNIKNVCETFSFPCSKQVISNIMSRELHVLGFKIVN